MSASVLCLLACLFPEKAATEVPAASLLLCATAVRGEGNVLPAQLRNLWSRT